MLKINPNIRQGHLFFCKRSNQSKHKILSFKVNTLIHASYSFLRRYIIRDRPVSFPAWIQSGGTNLMHLLAVHTVLLFHENCILIFCIFYCIQRPLVLYSFYRKDMPTGLSPLGEITCPHKKKKYTFMNSSPSH